MSNKAYLMLEKQWRHFFSLYDADYFFHIINRHIILITITIIACFHHHPEMSLLQQLLEIRQF